MTHTREKFNENVIIVFCALYFMKILVQLKLYIKKSGIFFFLLSNDTAQLKIIRFDGSKSKFALVYIENHFIFLKLPSTLTTA